MSSFKSISQSDILTESIPDTTCIFKKERINKENTINNKLIILKNIKSYTYNIVVDIYNFS